MQLITDKEGLPTITHTISPGSMKQWLEIMNSIVYRCSHCAHAWLDTLFIYLVWNGPGNYNGSFVFLLVYYKLIFSNNLSWFMVWKHFFLWDSETKNVLERCHVITHCKLSHLLLPKLLFFSFCFFFVGPLCYAVSQVKVCRVRVDTVSSHPSSLEVWKYSVTRPPPSPPFSFQNYLSISDKQLHQKTGLSSVNTELPDTIHQWDALCSKYSLQDATSVVKKVWFMKCSDFHLL